MFWLLLVMVEGIDREYQEAASERVLFDGFVEGDLFQWMELV